MRLTGQIRRDESKNLKTSFAINSIYREKRSTSMSFQPLMVPKKIQASPPYAFKPKLTRRQKSQTYLKKQAVVIEGVGSDAADTCFDEGEDC